MTTAAITLVLALLSLLTSSSGHAAPNSRTEPLTSLREWRKRIIDEDEKATANIRKIVTRLSTASLKNADRDLESPLNEIGGIDADRTELEARRRIVDQLIFAVDTKWSGTDLRGFFESQLLDFALTDLSDPGQGGWWKFLIQASISLRETAEPGADPIKFLEAYMIESGVLDPKPAVEILKSRDYIGS